MFTLVPMMTAVGMEEPARVYSYECLILVRESQEAFLYDTFVVHLFLPQALASYI